MIGVKRSAFVLAALVGTLAGARGTAYAQIKIITLAGPQSVVFGPDGKWVAADATDGSLKLWDVATGNEVHSVPAHSTPPDRKVEQPVFLVRKRRAVYRSVAE